MRKTFHMMAMVAVMAFGAAATTQTHASESVKPANAANVPATAAATLTPNLVSAVHAPQLARHTECTPDGTCYVYDDKGNVIVVIG